MELQQQTIHNGCVCACIAMLSGRPVEEVTKDYHHLLWGGGFRTSELLTREQIPFVVLGTEDNSVWAGRVYLACVPSLNLPGSFHAILIDARSGEMEVLDPAEEGKQRYTRENLHSWILEYEVVPSS